MSETISPVDPIEWHRHLIDERRKITATMPDGVERRRIELQISELQATMTLLIEKDALIERLQQELKEAREKTIEECATVADARVLWLEEKFGTEATAERVELEMIAKAIRSLDGGGK